MYKKHLNLFSVANKVYQHEIHHFSTVYLWCVTSNKISPSISWYLRLTCVQILITVEVYKTQEGIFAKQFSAQRKNSCIRFVCDWNIVCGVVHKMWFVYKV